MTRKNLMMVLGFLPEDAYLYKGKSKQPEEQKAISPTAPIEVAGIGLEEDEDDIDEKSKTSKSSLKVPLEISNNAGLSGASSGDSGLKV